MKWRIVRACLGILISLWICPVLTAQNPDTTGNATGSDAGSSRGPMGFALHIASKAYQTLLSEQLSSRCNFSPTCSRYSEEAFREFPFWKAWALTTDRLTRCNSTAHEHSPACLTNPRNGSVFDSVAWAGVAEMNRRREALVQQLLTSGDTLMAEKLRQSFRKSALLAGVYSALVPGLGKLYLGYPQQARSGFSTHFFLAAATAEMLVVSDSDPLKLASVGLFASFWLGNVWGSAQLKHRSDWYSLLENGLLCPGHPEDPDTTGEGQAPLTLMQAWQQNDYSRVYRLSQPPGDSSALDIGNTLLRWKAMIEMELFTECREEMMQVYRFDSLVLPEIIALPVSIQQKSPVKAQRLSAWLPGLGHCWAGYPMKGMLSFLLNAGSLVLTWKAVESGLYVNGALFGLYPFFRFYQGGKTYSYSLADRVNQKRLAALKKRYQVVVERM